MATPTCFTCRYWYLTEQGSGTGNQTCRRYPPTVVAEIFKEKPYPNPEAGVWPVTSSDDWCGEWAAKDE